MRFIPVDFGKTCCVIGQANACQTFQFSPATSAMLFLQPVQFADRVAYCNDFDLSDLADDLDFIGLHGDVIILLLQTGQPN